MLSTNAIIISSTYLYNHSDEVIIMLIIYI